VGIVRREVSGVVFEGNFTGEDFSCEKFTGRMSGGNVAEKFPGGDISQGGVIFLHCRSVREGVVRVGVRIPI